MLTQTKIAFVISALLAGAAFTTTATAATLAVDQTIARQGADDGAGDDRGGKGNPAIDVKDQLARNGADDGAGDDRSGRG